MRIHKDTEDAIRNPPSILLPMMSAAMLWGGCDLAVQAGDPEQLGNVAQLASLPPLGGPEIWNSDPFHGTHGTFFADVNGDGKADAVAVEDGSIGVLPSSGSGFGAYRTWSGRDLIASHGVFVADVTGDGSADAIAVGDSSILVYPSTGSSFGEPQLWNSSPFYGDTRGTYFVDVNADGKADAVAMGPGSIGVLPSTGSRFGPYQTWARYVNAALEPRAFIDVNGDERADSVVFFGGVQACVGLNSGAGFDQPTPVEPWFPSEDDDHGIYMADVTGDGNADAVRVGTRIIVVRRMRESVEPF